jgi:hypothetical protein
MSSATALGAGFSGTFAPMVIAEVWMRENGFGESAAT